MKTDLGANNNKYYIIQVLKKNEKIFYYLRYGRVGYILSQTMELMSLEAAEKKYYVMYKKKTAPGKYTPVEMDLGAGESTSVKAELEKTVDSILTKYADSKLPK